MISGATDTITTIVTRRTDCSERVVAVEGREDSVAIGLEVMAALTRTE